MGNAVPFSTYHRNEYLPSELYNMSTHVAYFIPVQNGKGFLNLASKWWNQHSFQLKFLTIFVVQ